MRSRKSQKLLMKTPVSIQENSKEVERAGYLIFLKRYASSKSERLFPKLITFDGQGDVWVRHQNDDSFNHATLRSWHRECVHVKGSINPEGVLIVRELSKEIDPAQSHE